MLRLSASAFAQCHLPLPALGGWRDGTFPAVACWNKKNILDENLVRNRKLKERVFFFVPAAWCRCSVLLWHSAAKRWCIWALRSAADYFLLRFLFWDENVKVNAGNTSLRMQRWCFFSYRPKKIKLLRPECLKIQWRTLMTSFYYNWDKWPKCLSEKKQVQRSTTDAANFKQGCSSNQKKWRLRYSD